MSCSTKVWKRPSTMFLGYCPVRGAGIHLSIFLRTNIHFPRSSIEAGRNSLFTGGKLNNLPEREWKLSYCPVRLKMQLRNLWKYQKLNIYFCGSYGCSNRGQTNPSSQSRLIHSILRHSNLLKFPFNSLFSIGSCTHKILRAFVKLN